MLIIFLILISFLFFYLAQKAIKLNKEIEEENNSLKKEEEEYINIENKKISNEIIEAKKINIKKWLKNKNYFEEKICPNCFSQIKNKKSTTFICPFCKKEINRVSHFINYDKLYLSKEEKEVFCLEKEKFKKYNSYVSLCKAINNTGIIKVSTLNIEKTLFKLHYGKKSFYSRTTFEDLRICRYYEGAIQEIYGTMQQATNAYMSVLYLDLLGHYDTLEYQWSEGNIFPHAYEAAFQEDLSIEEFEKIFLFNANSLKKSLQFTPPITPQEAWQEILKYREKNNLN